VAAKVSALDKWEQLRDKRCLAAMKKHLKDRITRELNAELAQRIKARTWSGLDQDNNPFKALKGDYKAWKEKVRPGRPILFFDNRMAHHKGGLVGQIQVISATADEVDLDYKVGMSTKVKDSELLLKKQRRHEILGVKRKDGTVVHRRFSKVDVGMIKALDAKLVEKLEKWAAGWYAEYEQKYPRPM